LAPRGNDQPMVFVHNCRWFCGKRPIQPQKMTDRHTNDRHRRNVRGAAKKWNSKVFRRFLSNRLGF